MAVILRTFFFFCAVLHALIFSSWVAAAPVGNCARPVLEKDAAAHFERLARKQLALEYGNASVDLQRIHAQPVGSDLFRVEALMRVAKPDRDNAASYWITGWLSRCEGTLVLRGNTWLADGTLVTPRFTRAQLPGQGLVMGREDAPLQVLVFVDSRCPHCHRLIAYARDLLLKDAIHIEFRQVAYLETTVEAAKDTRIHETALVREAPGALRADDYLDMLGEFNNAMDIDVDTPAYEKGLALIQTNTATARDILHVSTVPAVLVLDRKNTGEYRLVGLTEMNRLFQPEM